MTALALVETVEPPTRATPLRRPAVDAARRALIEALAEAGLKVLNPTIITEAVLRAYADAERVVVVAEVGRWSNGTRQIAAMAVGDTITHTGTRSTAHQRLKGARILMDNPAASWTMCVSAGVVSITRLPDGQKPAPRRWSTVVEKLIGLEIGERVLVPEIKPSPKGELRLSGYYKQAARIRMGQPLAEWISASTNHGLRVERVR
jgi:hypothetical protein